jgi:hypothetical protein
MILRSLRKRHMNSHLMCSRVTSTKSLSFCMATFRASLINLTFLLPQSRDYSCHVSRPILAPPPLWLRKHTALRAHDFAHSPELWGQRRLVNVPCASSRRLCGIMLAIHRSLKTCKHFSVHRDQSFAVRKRLVSTKPQGNIAVCVCVCVCARFCTLITLSTIWRLKFV